MLAIPAGASSKEIVHPSTLHPMHDLKKKLAIAYVKLALWIAAILFFLGYLLLA